MDSSPNFLHSLVLAFQAGGPWMIPIAIAFAVSIAFTIERFVRLFWQYNVDGASFMFEVQKYILANDLDGAIRLCNGAGRAALPKVIKAGLQRASRDEGQIQNAIDAASLEVIPKLERRLAYLALIANIATLLRPSRHDQRPDLVLRRHRARRSLAAPGDLWRAVSREAMNSTAFGLVTAIFTMIAHSDPHEQSQSDPRGDRRVRRQAPGSALGAQVQGRERPEGGVTAIVQAAHFPQKER